ncbi:conserved hypothetical protein [Nitrospina gracilis 3/211]|uniref:Uncharacterized protein n=1 Tax=Nitrospina gracilis (strain 3/211) TaxID=1266370 RepID=M1Z003_NITG3|nr:MULTISPECIES: hypothetical protein [Nitrospina]MCF8723744.1 hypothetical protein [Nitrospina sp. Nb-3]CCQ90844.1 conserved hypothetical protein [Nitrospina gracilis 3/211]
MSEQTNYTFLPWLRQGIANQISGHSGLRATIAIDLNLSGDKVDGGTETRPPIQKDIEIYGPGDVIGIDPQAIIKHEPRNWITNFEPNYLPYIEFYDEDFPWRYSPMSPAGPGNHRLQPWIALVVLKEEEFKDGKNIKDRPLPYITLDGASLPPSDQLWAWAHVHVNKSIVGTDIVSNNAANIESKMGALLRNDPDMAYSRILCPRKLEENVAYHAFLIPAFETGRLAGLGRDPADAPSHDAPAWSDAVTPPELPYYFRWYFRSGTVGDFEYLVRLLKPKPVDSRVGLRDMDVQNPGANIQGILDAPSAPDNHKLNGILKLSGALKIPDISYTPEEFSIIQKYRGWAALAQPYPHPFQNDLASFINLTDSYEQKPAQQANSESNIEEVQEAADPQTEYDIKQNPDPLITAPLYGRWHSLTQRLLKERDGTNATPNDNWVHDLNLDPRWRVAAGFGTKVVQENQENYMKAAWDQVGEVLESNKRIREAQLAEKTGWVWYTANIKPLNESFFSKWLVLSAPLHRRVLNQGVTVYHQILQSKVPSAILSPVVRKRLSPRGRLVKRLPFNTTVTPDNLIPRINEGEVSTAPPRVTPDANTLDDLVEDLKPQGVPGFVLNLVKQYPWLKWILLLIALLIIVLLLLFSPSTGILSAGLALAAGLVFLYFQFNGIGKRIEQAESVLEENQTPEAVDAMPHSPDFRISEPGENFTPTIGGTVDSEEAKRFKQALRDTHTIIQVSREKGIQPPKPALDIATVRNVLFDKLDPKITVPNWVWGSVLIPGRIKDQLDGDFVEAMAYPEFDLPMYKPLAEYSAELFLPNINFISENSISLLETNQKFIESYMVGLNHEFARELLWREYPTDQRGSYFRQFWEPQSFHDTEELSAEDLKEKLKDIPPIHKWLKHSDLGDHDHREVPGESGEEVVLVIRGELLKRYPNAVIYAHRAVWRDDTEDGNPILDLDSGQTIDLTKERDLRPLTPEEEANPPRTLIKTPLYEAKVDPDIYFFGFDLTACEALGGPGQEDAPMNEKCVQEGIAWNDPGWFFVIKERPGEIALGLDVPQEDDSVDDVKVWNDLSWNHVTPPVTGGGFLQINNATQTIELKPLNLPSEVEKETQKQEDENIHWNKDMSSADLAYVLYQVPVLVAVHASEMLPKT